MKHRHLPGTISAVACLVALTLLHLHAVDAVEDDNTVISRSSIAWA